MHLVQFTQVDGNARLFSDGKARIRLFTFGLVLTKASLICGLLTLALISSATQLKVLTVEQLTAAGEAVVHGIVKSKTVQRDPNGRIFTRVELELKEQWKGVRPVVSIVHGGGVLGSEAAFATDQEQYAIGEEVVVFVRFNSRGEAVTVGMNQGKFSVFEREGQKLIHNPFHGASRAEVDQGRKAMPVDELKARVEGGAR